MKKTLLLILFSSSVFANGIDDKCPNHNVWGAPIITDGNNQYLCRTGYAVNYNYKTKAAYYVLENVTKDHINGSSVRRNDFHDDAEIPSDHRNTTREFLRSGFDRGHLAPAADFNYSDSVMHDSFLMSNMTMQNQDLNRHTWNLLEQYSRSLVNKYNQVYIITGTIFGENPKVINTVSVPSHMYKILIDAKRHKVLAFMIPNKETSLDFSTYITTVAAIEKITSIDYSPKMPSKYKYLETNKGDMDEW